MFEERVNVAVCGLVEHGKSTLVGRLIWDLDLITPEKKRDILKNLEKVQQEKENKRLNQYSATVAWLKEEWEHGRTVFPSHVHLKLSNRKVTLIDTPGHPDFKRNRAYGLFMADSVIYVASLGDEFPSDKGLREENFILLRALGLPVLGLVLTKKDVSLRPDRKEEIFEFVKNQILKWEIPIVGESLQCLEVSAIKGENLNDLVSLLNNQPIVTKSEREGPLRFCVQGEQETFSVTGVGSVAKGILESGSIEINDKLLFQPASFNFKDNVLCEVKDIQIARGRNEDQGERVSLACAREIISVAFRGMKIDELQKYVEGGCILSHSKTPVPVAKKIRAEIIIINRRVPVCKNWEPYFLLHVTSSPARIIDIEQVVEINEPEKPLKRETIQDGQKGIVTFEFHKPLPIETFKNNPKLSRFTLREMNDIVGIGFCTEIIE